MSHESRPGEMSVAPADDQVVLEVWSGRLGQPIPFRTPYIATAPFPLAPRRVAAAYGSREMPPEAVTFFAQTVYWTILTLGYFSLSAEYLVEVVPEQTERQRKLNAKGAQKRPQLRTGLPRYILLDPWRMGEVGHPAAADAKGQASETSAADAAPRGHWRVLEHERFTEDNRSLWSGATWRGPHEWVAGGQRFRVVAPVATMMG